MTSVEIPRGDDELFYSIYLSTPYESDNRLNSYRAKYLSNQKQLLYVS